LTSERRCKLQRPLFPTIGITRTCFLAPPGSSLSLTIEVNSSHREAKVIIHSKLAGVEMIPEGRHRYSLSSFLLEEHKNEPVDANVGLWALVAYDLPSCDSKG
jgi:hypothetical protein